MSPHDTPRSSPRDADVIASLRAEVTALRQSLEHERSARSADVYAARLDRRLADERLASAVESASIAWWEHRFGDETVIRSPNWAAQLGYAAHEIPDTVYAWKSLIHPDDVAAVEEAARAHEAGESEVFEVEHRMRRKDGGWAWILNWGRIVERDAQGRPLRATGTHLDITRRRRAEAERAELVVQLEGALQELTSLRGIIPICAWCRNVRDGDGRWQSLEDFVLQQSQAQFTHGLCPDCYQRQAAKKEG